MTRRKLAQRYLVVLGAVCSAVLLSWVAFLYVPVIKNPEGYRYIVKSGTSIRLVADDLYAKNIITHRFYFHMLVRLRGGGHELKAGDYLFPKGSTPSSMLNQMLTGAGIIYHEFMIIPGWNMTELRAALLLDNNFQHVVNRLTDQELMRRLGRPGLLPEGEFFPDTYYFVAGSSDLALLKRAFKTMQTKLNTAWRQHPTDLPFKSPYDVLIAASLIEKEAYLNQERPRIAGVLVNRLRQDMLLQFDPTIIYGMGVHYVGKISKEDLQTDNPYNTYLHKGLPPTPIAIPSEGSILAAAHPEQHPFLYFVARGDGSHQFSETLAEHNIAIAALKKSNSWFNEKLVAGYWRARFDMQ